MEIPRKIKKNVFTKKITSENKVLSISLNSSKFKAPNLVANSLGSFLELAKIMPKVSAVIGPLKLKKSDNPNNINRKARDENIVFGNFLILLKIVDQIIAPIVPNIMAKMIEPKTSKPIIFPKSTEPIFIIFRIDKESMILITSETADSMNRIFFIVYKIRNS